MKRILIFLSIAVFIFAVTVSFAEETPTKAKDTKAKEDCAAACAAKKTATGNKETADPHAGCVAMKGETQATSAVAPPESKDSNPHAGCAAMKGEAQAATISAPAAEKAAGVGAAVAKDAHCPDVAGNDKLTNFHEPMHTMHTALNDGKYGAIRAELPNLEKGAVGLAGYKCPMGDKCPPECKKGFDAKKANLLNTVGELKTACQGTDNEVVKTAFMNMHAAYIEFASMCNEGKTAETKPAAEEKQ